MLGAPLLTRVLARRIHLGFAAKFYGRIWLVEVAETGCAKYFSQNRQYEDWEDYGFYAPEKPLFGDIVCSEPTKAIWGAFYNHGNFAHDIVVNGSKLQERAVFVFWRAFEWFSLLSRKLRKYCKFMAATIEFLWQNRNNACKRYETID